MPKHINAWEMLGDLKTGKLPSAVPADKLRAFESVELKDGAFAFSGPSWPTIRPPENLLERFLGARTDAALLRLARRFGPLLPLQVSRLNVTDYREPLEQIWRRFHWEFGFLLTLAAELREGSAHPTDPHVEYEQRGIRVERMATLGEIGRSVLPKWDEYSPESRRARQSSLFLQRVRFLVRSGELRPALVETETDYGGVRFNIVFQDGRTNFGISLLGALTSQFLAAATGSGFANCSSCGKLFVPERRQPAFGKRRYCDDCGRPAAIRDAKAAYRSRERERKASNKAKGTK